MDNDVNGYEVRKRNMGKKEIVVICEKDEAGEAM